MEPAERVKKPEPGRTQPVRNWNVLFERPAVPPPQAPPERPAPEGAAPPAEPVSRGVEMGYRVVEEYLRQGQSAARAMGSPSPPESTRSDDGLQNRMGAMLRTFSDFASLWLDLMGRVASGGAAQRAPGAAPAVGTAGPFSVGRVPEAEAPKAAAPEASAVPQSREVPEFQAAAPPGITLDIESARRTEVSIDLRPRAAELKLRVHDLRAAEPDLPRITGVTIEAVPEEERVAIRLRIPDDQPPGIYSGIILDERTGLPRGTLCVHVTAR